MATNISCHVRGYVIYKVHLVYGDKRTSTLCPRGLLCVRRPYESTKH